MSKKPHVKNITLMTKGISTDLQVTNVYKGEGYKAYEAAGQIFSMGCNPRVKSYDGKNIVHLRNPMSRKEGEKDILVEVISTDMKLVYPQYFIEYLKEYPNDWSFDMSKQTKETIKKHHPSIEIGKRYGCKMTFDVPNNFLL